MQTILLMAISFRTTDLFGQTPEGPGLDNNVMLNKQEAVFLNPILNEERPTFDFTNKKMAFVTGNSGNRLLTKSDFFHTYAKLHTDKGFPEWKDTLATVHLWTQIVGKIRLRKCPG